MLKLRKGHLRSTMKGEWLDNLDRYFSKTADDMQPGADPDLDFGKAFIVFFKRKVSQHFCLL